MENKVRELRFPVTREEIKSLKPGDMVSISGRIYCGRDAVLPRITKLIDEGRISELPVSLEGGLIFHTAVSRAGVGPTSSNKLEIEGSMEKLSKAGVRMHLGKGELKNETVKILSENDSVYAVIPPVTALLESRTKSRRVAAYPELGMEALYEIEVEEYPAVIAAAGGEALWTRKGDGRL